MTDELKPCPFCGAKARVYGVPREIDYMGVECTNYNECGCSIDAISGTRQRAIERWNRRAGEPHA